MNALKINYFALLLCLLPTITSGFGKNKVQYVNLKWQYNKLPHFDSYFHQQQGNLPQITAQWMEQAYEQLKKDFNFKHNEKIPLIVYGSPTLFEQTNTTQGLIPEGVGGFTEMLKNRIVVPFTGSYEAYRHVLHHELVHAFQFGILFDNFASAMLKRQAGQLPLWFAEGTAEFLSSKWDRKADMFMMDRVVYTSVPNPGPGMQGYIVYKGGQSFFFYLYQSRGKKAFYDFLHEFTRQKSISKAFTKIYGESLEKLSEQWQHELKRIYWPEIGKRENLTEKATMLTSIEKNRSYMNLNPRISPNGSKIAFYTDADDYTTIHVTDSKGKLIKKISQFGNNGFFDSFQPFRSGMAWSPNSDRLAYIIKDKGKNEIRITGIHDRYSRSIAPALLAISAPDWSPDGSSLIFTGLKDAQLDIYKYDLTTDSLRRLTNSIEEEKSPRFSPDGLSIIFSKKDTAGFANKELHHTRPKSNLFLLTLKDNSVKQLTSTPWNEDDPCFSPDGKQVAYTSDKNGVTNIYISSLENFTSEKALTNIIGGVSKPDWSKSHQMVFTLFQKQQWNVWSIEDPLKKLIDEPLEKTTWLRHLEDSSHVFYRKVPIKKDSSKVDSSDTSTTASKKTLKEKIIDDYDSGLSVRKIARKYRLSTSEVFQIIRDEKNYSRKDKKRELFEKDTTNYEIQEVNLTDSNSVAHNYKTKFSLDIFSLGMAYNSLYGPAGQGYVVFSDLLGNQQIAVSANVQGGVDENNFFLMYLNSKYRMDFGAVTFFERHYTLASLSYYHLYHDTDFGLQAMVSYPFSIFSRIDFNFFYKHLKRTPYIIENGKKKLNDSLPIENYDMTLPQLSYSFDNTLWGITGPVNGTRINASISGAIPMSKTDASFIAFDLDARRYFHLGKKFVWANKITTGFSEDLGDYQGKRRYFLGGNENWLFYSIDRENFQDNLDNTTYSEYLVPFRGWNYMDIVGSRYFVMNTEFRFPFIRSIDLVWPLPLSIRYINGVFFVDAGNAWDPGDQYKNIPIPKKIYGGVGFGFRINLGMFILKYDRAWKTDWDSYVKEPMTYFSLGAEF